MQGFDRLYRMLTDAGLKHGDDWDSRRANDELYILLPGGAKLYFKGGDRPDSIYGADYSWVVVDEGTRCKNECEAAIFSTTTATNGEIRIIGNVKGRNNWVYRLARMAESGDPDIAYHKLTCWDAVEAGVLEREVVEGARRMLPDHVFKELYECIPADDGGNPFGLSAIEACVGDLSEDEPVCWGVDLAKSQDWTVAIGLDAKGRVCRFERWQKKPWEGTSDELVSAIDGVPSLWDATGVGDAVVEGVQRRMRNVEAFKFSASSKQQLMEGLAGAINEGRVTYPEGPIRTELETFEYEYHKHGVRYSAPAGLHDDCVCALALAVEKRRRMGLIADPFVDAIEIRHDDGRSRMSFEDGKPLHEQFAAQREADPDWGF